MDQERRVDKRVPLMLEVRCVSLGQYSLQTYDVSLGGCYVEVLGELAIGQLVPFEIQLPKGGWISVHAQVVHHTPYIGLGLRFLGLTPTNRDLLARDIGQENQN